MKNEARPHIVDTGANVVGTLQYKAPATLT